ncbi:HK97 family phage prohead protease [Jannaschia sp. Os4]|uniref:HK97 family phage prohead protease n=1 Tax=Jannaschia sp. Os4 TaxID=2807617 RepID=UPI001939B9EA|nr:HK97 family phage prohead protease [Jannaschia sp. Os4]MBM2576818.1 HK97 family phage prohead protease [Jannaschia sp. Os4]
MDIETKAAPVEGVVCDGVRLSGHASLFGLEDGGGDVVAPGAFADCLARMSVEGQSVKMLWQHDPACVIGVWDVVAEDARGLRVEGRLLEGVEKAREAGALVRAGALDGLSIGYRVKRAERDGAGRRILREVELWEVSLVTFPMLREARAEAKAEARGVAEALRAARREWLR